jgi:predicted phosphoribosyltransferase
MPDNPEAGFGAIAEDGSTFFIPRFKGWIPAAIVRQTIAEQKE